MKTFEKWINKTAYDCGIRHDSFTSVYSIRGCMGKCKVLFNHFKSRGCTVIDDNGFKTEVKSVKEAIELVNFLVDGIC